MDKEWILYQNYVISTFVMRLRLWLRLRFVAVDIVLLFECFKRIIIKIKSYSQ